MRLDKYVALNYNLSRNIVSKLNKEGNILVNEKQEKNNYEVKENDDVKVNIKEEEKEDYTKYLDLIPILYEDKYLLIIDKLSGILTHKIAQEEKNVADVLKTKYKLSDIDSLRPGIVHRLDKDTSGLLIIVKDNKTHLLLKEMFKDKKIKKTYLAIVEGIIKSDTGEINAPIRRREDGKFEVKSPGKMSHTEFKVLKRFKNNTLVEVNLKTGRTHQIRVHFKYINHPVLNDPLYGKSINSFNQYLHSYKLEFIHPITNKNIMVKVEPPKEFKDKLDELE